MILNILLTLFLVFLNGFFVAAEFAIVKVRASQIELRIRSGSKLAKIAKNIIHHLDSYLSATQLGITLASLGLGWIGESVVSEIIKSILAVFGIQLTPELTHQIALPLAFLTITFLHIIFGELAPKSIAIQRPESTSLVIAVPLRIFYFIFVPFIWILNTLANVLIKLIGFQPAGAEHGRHSFEELRYLLEEGSKSGVIDASEHELLENVFEFSDTPVKQIMVPRGKIVGVEISMTSKEIMDVFIDEGYSRMPVYNNSIDNIIGVIYAKDFISMLSHQDTIVTRDIMRQAYFVREEQKINLLLQSMQKEKTHIAIVLDEFGGTAGLVTLEDIIEEIFGEIQDEYDEETPDIVSVSGNEFVIKAHTTIDSANDVLPVPLPDSEDYETVGGFITSFMGRIPELNESFDWEHYKFKILKRSKRSIELVKIFLIEKALSED
ncbi:MAG: hemolysin family protein [Bacteroidota bacterium]